MANIATFGQAELEHLKRIHGVTVPFTRLGGGRRIVSGYGGLVECEGGGVESSEPSVSET